MPRRFRLLTALWIVSIAAITFAIMREASIHRAQLAALLAALEADPCLDKGAWPYPRAVAFQCAPRPETLATIERSNIVLMIACPLMNPDAERSLEPRFTRDGGVLVRRGPFWSRGGALAIVWLIVVGAPLAHRFRTVRIVAVGLVLLAVLFAVLTVLDAPAPARIPEPAASR